MTDKLKPCPFCGGKMVATPFICKVAELPKPIRLFGKWSLIKMQYREIPCNYVVECDDYCDGWFTSDIHIIEDTKAKAIENWNRRSDNDR